MMQKDPFSLFIDLVNVDRTIFELTQAKQEAEHEIGILQEQEKKLNADVAHAKEQAHDAKKKVMAVELAIKELDADELKKKSQFERVSGQKEYYAVQAELEQLNTKRLQLEDDLMTAWHTAESAERDYLKNQTRASEHLHKLAEAIGAKEQEKKVTQARIDEHIAQRDDKERGVPEDWLATYVSMRSQVADPVVPDENGMCSVCMYPITGADMAALRRHTLVQCKGCFRLLYLASMHKS